MEINTIISLVTMGVTFICGLVAKKVKWFNNKLIPIQNLLIGIISVVIYYLITGDIELALTGVGLLTGGAYDLGKNLYLLFTKKQITETKETN